MADSSFDIVSKIDRQEVDNALSQAAREISQRYDFKGTGAEIKWSGAEGIEITANAEMMVAAVDAIYMMPKPATASTPSRTRQAQPAPTGADTAPTSRAPSGVNPSSSVSPRPTSSEA